MDSAYINGSCWHTCTARTRWVNCGDLQYGRSNSPLRQSVWAIALICGGPGWMSATSLCYWGVGMVWVMHRFVHLIHYIPGDLSAVQADLAEFTAWVWAHRGWVVIPLVTDKRRQTGGLRVAGIVLVCWVWELAAFCGAHSQSSARWVKLKQSLQRAALAFPVNAMFQSVSSILAHTASGIVATLHLHIPCGPQ